MHLETMAHDIISILEFDPKIAARCGQGVDLQVVRIACRDLLEPGNAVIARVEADVEGEEVKLRLQGVEMLDKAAAQMVTGLEIFVRDSKPLESIAARLTNGGRAPIRLVMLMEQGREVHVSLGNKFTVTPQIKGAIKAIAGVVDVQDL